MKMKENEKILCSLIKRGYIARDKRGTIYWYIGKPTKLIEDAQWRDTDNYSTFEQLSGIFPDCKFDFIKWEDEEPWKIEEDGSIHQDNNNYEYLITRMATLTQSITQLQKAEREKGKTAMTTDITREDVLRNINKVKRAIEVLEGELMEDRL